MKSRFKIFQFDDDELLNNWDMDAENIDEVIDQLKQTVEEDLAFDFPEMDPEKISVKAGSRFHQNNTHIFQIFGTAIDSKNDINKTNTFGYTVVELFQA